MKTPAQKVFTLLWLRVATVRGLQAEGGALTSRLTTAATGSPAEGLPCESGAKKVPGSVMNVSSGFLGKFYEIILFSFNSEQP